MKFWTLGRVAAAVGGQPESGGGRGDTTSLASITTDSRRITTGQVFVALVGENFDGHDFVASAVERGAAAVVVSKAPAEALSVPVFLVPDTLVALGELASTWRRAWGGP
ncbi:MAG: Mur ligase domain-containing protein, partial [Gemmatimonadaceae bacterium]